MDRVADRKGNPVSEEPGQENPDSMGETTAQDLRSRTRVHHVVRLAGLGAIGVTVTACFCAPWLAGKLEEKRRSGGHVGEMHRLPPMVVRLVEDPPRNLRVRIVFEAADHRTVAGLNRWATQIRESIGTLLGAKRFEEINSPAERKMLKRRIADTVNSITGTVPVSQVYFEEFRLDGFGPIQFFRDPFDLQKGRESYGQRQG